MSLSQPPSPDSPARPDTAARRRSRWLLAFLAVSFVGLQLWARSARVPAELAVRTGRLRPCPDKANCVNSLDGGPAAIAPLPYPADPATTRERLRQALLALPGVSQVHEDGDWWHAECRSRVLGFVDDLELLLDDRAGIIHVRSASRLGYSDFGVNRRRVERLRQLLERAP